MKQIGFKAFLLSLLTATALSEYTQPPPIGHFTKRKTVFDGVTFDENVTYLKLKQTEMARLELASSTNVNEDIDLTAKFWFKFTAEKEQQEHQFWSLQDSVFCTLNDGAVIRCTTPKRKVVQIQYEIALGKWYYMSLSVSRHTGATLTLWDTVGSLASDTNQDFRVQQTVPRGYTICFGTCEADLEFGFTGGIREVLVLTQHQSEEDIFEEANQYKNYDRTVAGYYRFRSVKMNSDRFLMEEFRVRKAHLSESVQTEPEIDFIPVDICPLTFNTQRMIEFGPGQDVVGTDFIGELAQQNYEYTMTTHLFISEKTCFTDDIRVAQDNCNLIHLEGVFMLFFQKNSLARFHFFASKNYYESQSAPFFLPYNQWITIQMQMSHYSGYQIALLDQMGNVILNFAKVQNMQRQIPSSTLSLFSGLTGFASEFILVDKAFFLPQQNAKLELNALVNVDFFVTTRKEINNRGKGGIMTLRKYPSIQAVGFQSAQYKQLYPPRPKFDGVACDDDHNTMQMLSTKSYLKFDTPFSDFWLSETSILFWFKIPNWESVTKNEFKTVDVFVFENSGNNFDNYWQIQFEGDQLRIAPYGYQKSSDPFVIFDSVNQENEDESGWWHLSCWLEYYKKFECTIHNTKNTWVQTESLQGIMKEYPKISLRGVFGKPFNQQYASGVKDMYIKEFSYWNRKVLADEVEKMRYFQIDPRKVEGLFTYFKLSSALPEVKNLAEYNEKYVFEGTNPSFALAKWNSEYRPSYEWIYNDKRFQMQDVLVKNFHRICPVNTYLEGDACYKDPVNHPVLAIFPQWNVDSNRLDWVFTLEESTFINKDVINQIESVFTSKQPSLNEIFTKTLNPEKPFERVISSDLLRNEAEYEIKAGFTNSQNMFWATDSIDFIPNKCQWMVVGDDDARTGRSQMDFMPGTEDFTFKLVLKNHGTDSTCNSFYDKFASVSFDFIVGGHDALYMTEKPKVKVELTTAYEIEAAEVKNEEPAPAEEQPAPEQPVEGGRRLLDDPSTHQELVVVCTIPASEQYKIPVWQDVKILMSTVWTSSLYSNTITTEHFHAFQNLMYTIHYNPVELELKAEIESNYQYVQKGQTLILTSDKTTVSDLFPEQVQKMLSYEWVCPEGLEFLCERQTTPTLYVPWKSIQQVSIVFSKLYTITARITWTDPQGNKQVKEASTEVQWYNVAKPEFIIENTPKQALITSIEPLTLEINGINFETQSTDFSVYEINWIITPEIKETAIKKENNSGKLVIEAGNLQENTIYTVKVEMFFKERPEINNSVEQEFQTFAPPIIGDILVEPPQGYFSETQFVFSLVNWKDANYQIYYNLYEGATVGGSWQLGIKLNKFELKNTDTFSHIVDNENVIIIEVYNEIGETTYSIVRPWVVDKPAQVCETTKDCPEPVPEAPAEEPAPAAEESAPAEGGRRRRLQSAAETLEAKVQPGDWSQSVFNEPDGCTYTKSCVQPEYDWEGLPRGDVQLVQYIDYTIPKQLTIEDIQQNEVQNEGRRLQTQVQTHEIAQFCNQIGEKLRQSTNPKKYDEYFTLFKQHDEKPCILDEINKQARFEKNLEVSAMIFEKVTFEYRSSEIYSFVQKISKHAIQEKLVYNMHLFDAVYQFDSSAIEYLFPANVGQDFLVRLTAIKGVSGETQVKIQIQDTLTNQVFEFRELDGQVRVAFVKNRLTYVPDQTTCQGLISRERKLEWTEEVCLTEDLENDQVMCTCGLTTGVMAVSFRHDPSVVVQTTDVTHELKQTYTLVWFVSALVLAILVSSFYLYNQDKLDLLHIKNLSGWKLEVVAKVAKNLDEDVEKTKQRQQEIIRAYTCETTSVWQMIQKVHPTLSPYTSHNCAESRLTRFMKHSIQFNLITLALMLVYGPSYRANDVLRQVDFLDNYDLEMIQLYTLFGALASLPLFPSINHAVYRAALSSLLFSSSIGLFVGAAWMCKVTPTANQICLIACVCSTALSGFIGTNMARALFLTMCQMPYLTPSTLKELMKDLKAVKEIRELKQCDLTEVEMFKSTLDISSQLRAGTEVQPPAHNNNEFEGQLPSSQRKSVL